MVNMYCHSFVVKYDLFDINTVMQCNDLSVLFNFDGQQSYRTWRG